MLSYHLVTFTDFYQNYEVRYTILGNSFISCVFLIIGINSMVIIQVFIH